MSHLQCSADPFTTVGAEGGAEAEPAGKRSRGKSQGAATVMPLNYYIRLNTDHMEEKRLAWASSGEWDGALLDLIVKSNL